MGKLDDLSGRTFERLTVIEMAGRTKWGNAEWLCRCNCGNIVKVPAGKLKSGNTKSCGCLSKEVTSSLKRLPIRGNDVFGRLTTIASCGVGPSGDILWKCQCSCGNDVVIAASSLTTGNTSSCGCLSDEIRSAAEDLVGMSFGKLTVVREVSRIKRRGVVWGCVCSCGNRKEVLVTATSLRSGHTKSCGCQGRIRYDGHNFRSGLELYFYIAAQEKGIHLLYEQDTIDVLIEGVSRKYHPDFRIVETGEMIEVKGYPREMGMKKFEQAKRTGWNIRLFTRDNLVEWCGYGIRQLDKAYAIGGAEAIRQLISQSLMAPLSTRCHSPCP